MHEASIAVSILDIVVGLCQREGYPAIESVRIRVGKGSNILPEALCFAFSAARKETIAADARLVIEEVGITAICLDCGKETELEDSYSLLACAACSSYSLRILSGYEMEIVDMEVAEADEK
jgi:hydrogenase nickel incorporation protein HypA/HybF